MPVYFARAGQDGLVKIGYAIDVAARIRHLQCGLPFDLVVVREVEGSRRKERVVRAASCQDGSLRLAHDHSVGRVLTDFLTDRPLLRELVEGEG